MKERDSNIELLRILATLFILILHCNGWLLQDYGGVDGWLSAGRGVAMSRIVIQNITMLGVDLFILISGFYGMRPKLKSIVNLFTLLLYFYVGCYLWDCASGYDVFTWPHFAKSMLAFSRANWFINSYLFLMLLVPLINAFVDASDTRKLGIYTIIYCAATLYFGYYMANQYWYYNEAYSVTMMVGVYLLGRYINRVKDKLEQIRYWHLVIAFIVLIIIMSIIRVFVSNEEAWLHYGSPITMLASGIFFMLFCRMPKFQSKFINWIGVSCLAAFILHTCSPVLPWLARKDVAFFMNDAYPIYCVKMLAIVCGIFMIAVALDKVRLLIFKPLITWCGKIKQLN